MNTQQGDTVFAAQILTNISKNFEFESSFARSISYSLDEVWYRKAEDVCKSSLITPIKFPPWGHYYFISFPLGLLLRFINIYWFIAFLQSLIYSSVLLFVYLLARNYKINIFNSILLVLISIQHPLWIQGLYGQFYFNRFFLLFCSLVILLLSKIKLNYFLITIFSLFAISSNEIYGITLFMISIVYFILFKRDKKIFAMGLFTFVISLIFVILIKHYAQATSTQNSVVNIMFSGGLLGVLNNVISVIFTTESRIFLVVNFIFSGFVVFFRPKLFLAWIFFLIPNLLVYVGKNSWSTHYHISYFIPTLWLMVYSVSLTKYKSAILSCCLFGYFVILSGYKIPDYVFGKPRFIVDKLIEDYNLINLKKFDYLNKFNRLQSAVKLNDKISVPEAIAYPYLHHEIYYYPVEIDVVDRVVMLFDRTKQGDKRFSSINYGQQDVNLDDCILARMRNNKFNLDNPQIIDDVAIIGKKI